MDAFQLETKLQELTDEHSTENFIFDFLLAYGMPKSNISRLKKKSDVNSLSTDGELLVKNKKFFFKVVADIATVRLDNLVEAHKGMRIIMLTDYSTLCAYDTKTKMTLQIEFDELSKNYDFFLPLAGVEKTLFYDEKEADVKASVKMAKLFDEVKKSNPTTNEAEVRALNVFLTRLLFCFFAEDSNMFGASENLFTNYIETVSKQDGSDLNKHIKIIFDTLNSEDRDIANNLQDFPYVNGGLFKESYPIPTFTAKSRKLLIECGSELNWSQINPDIFGSMIQAVITEEHRGGLGMHYTSVPNIMKVIEPLFLDELHEEFEKAKGNTTKLNRLHQRIINLKIFDPACGSGNFLIIAYKELRRLEMRIFQEGGMLISPSIELNHFYGIELDDFAHEVAILSLWLTEHQMNLEFKKQFGNCPPNLPLQDKGNIVHGNATRLEWDDICPKIDGDEIYILGNPPYLGSRNQSTEQKEDMQHVFIKDYKSLDYIACWFYLGANYIRGVNAKYAFVSTNSISQGEQVALTWQRVLKDDLEIYFAHQSFKWMNNAKKNANVIVVIIGLANISTRHKYIYNNYIKQRVNSINPYLLEGKTIYILGSSRQLSKIPDMNFGNMPADGGKLLFTHEEKNEFINKEPTAEKWFKELISAHEFLNGKKRYSLWLEDITSEELNQMPLVLQIVNELKEIRANSSRPQLAEIPHLFAQITQPKGKGFILIPAHSSEHRKYIPIGFFQSENKAHNSCLIVATDDVSIFGLLTSYMHMLWMKTVGGRLKTDYRYSKNVVYNTFPFPKITNNQKNEIEKLVNLILDARDEEFTKTLAQLYDPDKMPDKLKQAHKNLDLYIEQCYRKKPFESDKERLAYLFKLYEKMIKEEDAK